MTRIIYISILVSICYGCGPSAQLTKQVNENTRAALDQKCKELKELFIQKVKINERPLRVLLKDDGRKVKPKFIDDDIKFPVRVEIDDLYVSGYSTGSLEFGFLITAAQANMEIPLREVTITANLMDENECRRISNSICECYLSQKKLSRLLANSNFNVNGEDILHQSTFSIKVKSIYSGVVTSTAQNTLSQTVLYNCQWSESGYWSNYTDGFLFDCNAY